MMDLGQSKNFPFGCMRDIHHDIQLLPDSSLPNIALY